MVAYLALADVLAIHDDLIKRYGGEGGLRDEGLLESALMRPQMASHYEQADLVRQAATLIAGILKNHPFLDGNKRTAAMAGATFLRANGYRLIITEPLDFAATILTAIPLEMDHAIATLEEWIRSRAGVV